MPTPASLPSVLQEIAEVAGVEAAWALAEKRGGTKVFLPRWAGPKHWLSEIVGQDAANKICGHFRSNHQDHIILPKASAAMEERRWAEVLARKDLSINMTALIMGVHISTVSRRRARQRPVGGKDDEQGVLF